MEIIKILKNKTYNLLRKSEKYTKTDMVYLAKGGSWLTLGQIISSASAFLLAVAFANLLPKEIYGVYKYIISIVSILTITTLPGMGIAITRAVARGYEGSFIPALKTKISWGLLGGLASLGLSGYYYLQGNITLTISFLIAAIFLPFMDSFSIYNSLLQGKKLFNVSTKYGIASQIIAVAILISALFFTKNLFIILFAYFISWTLLRFIFLKTTLKKFPPNNQGDIQTISYGKHLSLMRVIGIIAGQLDKILLWHFLGAAPVAIYSFATAPIVQFRALLKSITPLVLPKLSVGNKEKIKKTLPVKMIKFLVIIIIPVILYIIFAPYIFKILFPQYLESIKYSQYLALIILFFPKKLLGLSILIHADKKILYLANILPPTINIILLIILLPLYGIFGIILAITGKEVFTTIMLIYFFKKM